MYFKGKISGRINSLGVRDEGKKEMRDNFRFSVLVVGWVMVLWGIL